MDYLVSFVQTVARATVKVYNLIWYVVIHYVSNNEKKN